jgi:MFS transporter, DHA1 family, inner membrane transport protein
MRLHEAPPARGLVATLTRATFVNHLNVIAWNPFLPFIAAEIGVTVALLGQVPALMMLLATSLGLVIGPLADHYGSRRTLLIGLLAVVTSSLATGLAATLPILVLAALVGAVGRAAIMPVAQAIVTSAFVDDIARRRAVSRTQSGGPVAATVGIPLLTVSAAAWQWRSAFLVVSGLALATALRLWGLLSRDVTPGRGHVRLTSILAAYRPLVRHRASLTLIVAACLEHAGVWAMWTYYGAFYVQQHAFTIQQIGWVSLVAGLGVLLGQTVAGWQLGGRPRQLFLIGCIGSGPLTGLSLLLPLPAPAAVALMAAGWLMHGLIMVSTVVLLVDQSPAGRATTLTLYASAMNFGVAFGTALGGLALAQAGYVVLGLCTLALPLVSAVLVWCCHREPERHQHSPVRGTPAQGGTQDDRRCPGRWRTS